MPKKRQRWRIIRYILELLKLVLGLVLLTLELVKRFQNLR